MIDWSLEILPSVPFDRPIDVRFIHPENALYALDFGEFEMDSKVGFEQDKAQENFGAWATDNVFNVPRLDPHFVLSIFMLRATSRTSKSGSVPPRAMALSTASRAPK
jgi:hypothetical protein